ncbi:1-(5-phosphoribosyl)-5-[(5-phosphoribosylamino)methylideneamino]imidazole-4-carboxamide isomerase [Thermodesulfobacteriota bacterium]
MIVIPAIDIKDSRCVRLKQGLMSEETVYSEDPAAMAVKWAELGAERLHLVDLNGAVRGEPVNKGVIGRIAKAVSIPIQLGGGIRNMSTLESYFTLGVHQAILGSAAHRDPEFFRRACREFPGKIILGIDAKEDHVAIEGWTEETNLTPVELAKRFEAEGIWAVIYTDIQKDGMKTGPNIPATEALSRAVEIPVIASGGISDIHDVEEILELSSSGVIGMITGRAIYDGTLDLQTAIKRSKEHDKKT